jgi:hypothetical protein
MTSNKQSIQSIRSDRRHDMKLFSHSWRVLSSATALLTLLCIQGGPVTALAADPTSSVANTVYVPQVSYQLPLLNDAVKAIEPQANGGATFQAPVDAALDPDAKNTYFIANSAQGMGVFKSALNGSTVVSLTVGSPFTTPLGLDVSTDGQTIFVADPGAAVQSHLRRPQLTKGMIFRLAATGGAPVAVAGTEGTAPRGLTIVSENGADMIYFTGVDPTDAQPAVMKIPATGGTFTLLDKGSPLVQPTGIVVNKDGLVYITDQASAPNGLGNVFQIKQHHSDSNVGHDSSHPAVALDADKTPLAMMNSHRELLATVRGGNPAGLTLTQDQSLLLVSSLDSAQGTSQVLVINMSTRQQGIVNTVISANTASGGLHRAYNSPLMVWCGSTIGNSGTVFRVELK